MWTHPENPALSTMTVTGPTDLVQTIAATLEAGVRGLSRDELAGRTRGMAELDLLVRRRVRRRRDAAGLARSASSGW